MKRQFKSQITLFWEKKKHVSKNTLHQKDVFREKNIKIILVVTFVSVGQIVN